MEKIYEPKQIEKRIYAAWEKSGFFNPDNLKLPKNAKSYTIVFPPPNITAQLHLGHASTIAIEDLLIRYHRMRGFRTLWVPGTDHAAIATQNVVEKKLWSEEKKTRHDLGKEAFLEKVWEFLKITQSRILLQTRRMGASMDWSREAFTLDAPRKKAVTKLFVEMFNEGVIYRGERIVNWCPRCHSTLADDEVEHEEQGAKFYTFRYSQDFPFAIATTRPETKLGDTAVAVNSKDKRYAKYVGQTFAVSFCGVPLKIKIIADRNVEPEFGTGALGVTPAHSMVDWKMAEENGLEIVKVIDEDGNVYNKSHFAEFAGKSVQEARQAVVEKLEAEKLIEKTEDITNNLSVCYRCGTAIEPLPSKQWFVSVDKKLKRLKGKSLKEKALEVAKKGEIKFVPERFSKKYSHWMENLHDWCISRQIWFGHPIPVWYRGEEIYCGEKMPQGKGWTQDPDSLDTWFSSGMWTFSTLGWPDAMKGGKKIGDLKKFHPTQVLETGYEILTLWVSRMIMMSLFALGEIPFEDVYLHGMILDGNGKKMSKSSGNGVDPVDMIDKYGTDAVRLSLLIGNTPGNDMRLSEEKIENSRNFCNKLWNIRRYIQQGSDIKTKDSKKRSLADEWILSRVDRLSQEVTVDIKKYQFSQAGERLRDFTWGDFADWYLEIHKIEKNDFVLNYIFKTILKLWHPFIPFVTEELFAMYRSGKDDFLMVETWPQNKLKINKKAANEFALVQSAIVSIRNIRSVYKIDPQKKVSIAIVSKKSGVFESQQEIIKRLARVENIKIFKTSPEIENSACIVLDQVKIYVLLEDIIDVVKERDRLQKEVANIEGYISGLDKRLKNKEFVKKAPPAVVEKEQANLLNAKIKLVEAKKHLADLH